MKRKKGGNENLFMAQDNNRRIILEKRMSFVISL